MSRWPDSRNGTPGRSSAGQPIPVFFSTLLVDVGLTEGSAGDTAGNSARAWSLGIRRSLRLPRFRSTTSLSRFGLLTRR